MPHAPFERTARVMSEAEAAWVAGLLEGEGSFLAIRRSGGTTVQGRISINMTDRDVLEKLAAIVGVGRVRPYANPGRLGKKPGYQWVIQATADVEAVCRAVLPHMGERRSGQIRAVLDVCAAKRTTYGEAVA